MCYFFSIPSGKFHRFWCLSAARESKYLSTDCTYTWSYFSSSFILLYLCIDIMEHTHAACLLICCFLSTKIAFILWLIFSSFFFKCYHIICLCFCTDMYCWCSWPIYGKWESSACFPCRPILCRAVRSHLLQCLYVTCWMLFICMHAYLVLLFRTHAWVRVGLCMPINCSRVLPM